MPGLKFTVDSALLRELGEKLVETVHLALVELVKNSYDADATKVRITFDEDEHGAFAIRVEDDGTGMNFAAVKNYWMRIATSVKTLESVSPVFGRPRTGEKGIGRFCCRRLGGKLKLITQGSKDEASRGRLAELERTVVEFPWKNFEPGTDVTDIECPGTQSIVENQDTGTRLIITDLSFEWTTRGFNWLKRQLAVLAANRGNRRPGYEDDPGFNIALFAPGFEGGEIKDMRDLLVGAGWGTLTASIDSEQRATCTIDALSLGTKTFTSQMTFPLLQDVSLKVGIMVADREQMRDTTVLSQGTLSEILPEWGGIQVRYHGFRVYPYGDDDWLGFDHDRSLRRGTPNDELAAFAQTLRGVNPKRSLLNLLSMRNYIGNVEIGPGASGFEMKANREGFLSSPAVAQLREFVRFAIDWATIYRDFYLRNLVREEAEEARISFSRSMPEPVSSQIVVEKAVEYINKEIKNLSTLLPARERRKVENATTRATDAILKHENFNRQELSHLRLISATSTLLLVFSHEVKALLGLLEEGKNSLSILAQKSKGPEADVLRKMGSRLGDLKDRFEDLLNLTSLISVDHRKAQPGQVALRERVTRAVSTFKLILEKYEVAVDYKSVANNAVVSHMLEAELYAILLNALSNAIKSVIAAGGKRRIQISATREQGATVITVRDSGVGISATNFEEVFVPFVADPDDRLYSGLDKQLNPEDQYVVGTGSGLGLSIMREIVTARGGSVKFRKPKQGWAAELEMRLP